ncbi:MAG: hypothetical protein AAFX50_23675, partial [Acidobacteriota bacterium]
MYSRPGCSKARPCALWSSCWVHVYSTKARFCLLLTSEHYVEKAWTQHELQSAQGRAFEQPGRE